MSVTTQRRPFRSKANRLPIPSRTSGSLDLPAGRTKIAGRAPSRPSPILSAGQIAHLLGCAPRTVAKWFDAGKLGGYRLPATGDNPGDRRIPIVEFLAFCRAQNIPLPCLGLVAVVGYRGDLDVPGRETLFAADWVTLALQLAGRPVVAWVIDYQAGRTEGDRAAALIRAADPGLPVARLLPEDVTAVKLTGVTRDFRRPFDPDELARWLAERLVRRQA